MPSRYLSDRLQAKGILKELAEADRRILKTPPVEIIVAELADDGVVLAVRPFVKGQDYWDVKAALAEQIKLRFDEAGISLALPCREIHLNCSQGENDIVWL